MDQKVCTNSARGEHWTTEDIQRQVEESPIVIFSKGTREHPRCGFSERAMNAIEDCGKPYQVVDISQNKRITAALRKFAGPKCPPLVYVKGSLVSSSETLNQMLSTGELKSKVDKAFS